jgi:hypothetical protein
LITNYLHYLHKRPLTQSTNKLRPKSQLVDYLFCVFCSDDKDILRDNGFNIPRTERQRGREREINRESGRTKTIFFLILRDNNYGINALRFYSKIELPFFKRVF